jgi:hypothetical protein
MPQMRRRGRVGLLEPSENFPHTGAKFFTVIYFFLFGLFSEVP